MKSKKFIFIGIISAMALVQSAQAYTPPTDGELTNLLANPKLINLILGDADGKEAAVLMKRIIDRVMASTMAEQQIDYLIAFYSGRIASLLNETEAGVFATELFSTAPVESLPAVFAGLSVGRGGSTTFLNVLKGLAGENEALQTAINTPNITLTTPVYNLLVDNLASAQTLPPSGTDSLPPPRPQQGTGGTTPPPVIPPGYAGQG